MYRARALACRWRKPEGRSKGDVCMRQGFRTDPTRGGRSGGLARAPGDWIGPEFRASGERKMPGDGNPGAGYGVTSSARGGREGRESDPGGVLSGSDAMRKGRVPEHPRGGRPSSDARGRYDGDRCDRLRLDGKPACQSGISHERPVCACHSDNLWYHARLAKGSEAIRRLSPSRMGRWIRNSACALSAGGIGDGVRPRIDGRTVVL